MNDTPNLQQYLLNPRICQGCGNPIVPVGSNGLTSIRTKLKFCSRSCSVRVNNARRKDKPLKACLFCGGLITSRNPKFCSSKCSGAFTSKTKYEAWKAGGNVGIYVLRRYLLKRSNGHCERCGWAEVHPTTGKVPLEVNHVDGNWLNNDESNLEHLCPNCHSLTPNFRALNKGYGRAYRRGIIAEGRQFNS